MPLASSAEAAVSPANASIVRRLKRMGIGLARSIRPPLARRWVCAMGPPLRHPHAATPQAGDDAVAQLRCDRVLLPLEGGGRRAITWPRPLGPPGEIVARRNMAVQTRGVPTSPLQGEEEQQRGCLMPSAHRFSSGAAGAGSPMA